MECGVNGGIGRLVLRLVEVEIKRELACVIILQWRMVELLVLAIHLIRKQRMALELLNKKLCRPVMNILVQVSNSNI